VATLARKLYLFAHGAEAFRNQALYPFRAYSPILSVLVWKYPGLAFPFGLLLPFALTGMGLAARRVRTTWPLLLFIVSHVAVIVLFFVCARYRMNILPCLVIFAAFSLNTLAGYIRHQHWTRLSLFLACLGGLTILSNWDIGPMPASFNADAYYSLGARYMEEGRPEAKALLEQALALDPDLTEANGNLALILIQEHDLAGAKACLEVILKQYPTDVGAHINMTSIQAYQGDIEGAKERLRRVLIYDPGNTLAQQNLRVLERKSPPERP
jgi:hypothetical protein